MRIPFSYYVQIACGMKNVSYRKHLTIPLWRHEDVILEFYETKPIFSKMIVKWTVCKLKYSLLGYTSCFHFLSYFSNTVLILKKDEEGNSTTWAYYTAYHRQISSLVHVGVSARKCSVHGKYTRRRIEFILSFNIYLILNPSLHTIMCRIK